MDFSRIFTNFKTRSPEFLIYDAYSCGNVESQRKRLMNMFIALEGIKTKPVIT